MVYWERPYKARLEPPGMGLRRLYDLPVFTTTGTLSLTSRGQPAPCVYITKF
ncbi:hypothetical protein YEP4_19790 [Yersinia enterocolitica subsp. palearctica YE-P4]|nr:hypothetical protein YE150_19825 [Yersinia enterocolitica subsp. palearctica YE-150]EOR64946.1 hypothetical protein YEP4_19790 [Yersinia enterocolitica subsp. palearctica YE-P4]EOR65047.1 hypothetical protein YEP1_19866 [Yersinia enterocolitica subsp. palearctica YE-P1]EOR65978.1 hypothetical protein YE149_19874 [Yersinia enterocolitica subsp. palearctica YE-149]